MTVKELREELEFYDSNAEVVFEINDDIECESWTEDRYGNKTVSVNCELNPTFICEIHGNCNIELGVKE